ncbi:MAG: HD-GYP domain-containing protein [Treponema sp.]|jgi:HD-GYP domain-containing protein (c-di-GMP phosphodiesterase class II)|nr:HD-GYP domain-containing protein [Treponema sp.]
MEKIEVTKLKEGLVFNNPLFIDEDSIFVTANTRILKKDIDLLTSLGVKEVFVKKETDPFLDLREPVSIKKPTFPVQAKPVIIEDDTSDLSSMPKEPFLDSSINIEDDASDMPSMPAVTTNADIYISIARIVEQLNGIFDAIAARRMANIRLLWNITDSLIDIVKKHRNCAINSIFYNDSSKNIALAKNSVDSAIISAIIGKELNLDESRNQELIVAAILHDVGMLRLPRDIVTKQGKLSADDVQVIQSHPVHSSNIIKNELLYPNSIGHIALQHHERWDGNGYPRRLSGTYINSRSLIVAVADAFVAMVSNKPYRNSMSGYIAMKTILSENASHFSPDVLKVFLKIMGIYPLGSLVLLNDGSMARIVDINEKAPLRPVIQIVPDIDNNTLTGNKIDLLSEKSLFITRAITPA